ncbi:MAG: Pyrrolo-quinoline quinone [Planctomycetes bacterium]|nr:Pyrrolo-quinoline quinone [Planctomycetota bacterium]
MCAAAALALAGCWGGPADDGEDDAADGASFEAAPWPMFHGRPDLAGAAPGRLPRKLTLRWRFQADGAIKSAAAIDPAPLDASGRDARVFVGSSDCHVYALALADGRKLWAYKTAGGVEAAPLVLEGAVYVGSNDGVLYALDAATGTLRWEYETGGQIPGGANWARSPQGDRTWILVGSYDMLLHCLDAGTGQVVWTHETGNYINGTPAVGGGRIVFGGCDALVHILSAADGSPVATVGTDAYVAGSAALADGRIFVANYQGRFFCIDLETQRILWHYGDDESPFYSSPAVGPRQVVIGCGDNKVHCIDRGSGRSLWTFATRGNVDSSPAICGNRVVVGSGDGRLYVLRLSDGRQAWSYEVGQPVTASPAVSGGWVVVGGEDGAVYAFGPEP